MENFVRYCRFFLQRDIIFFFADKKYFIYTLLLHGIFVAILTSSVMSGERLRHPGMRKD